VKQIPKYYINNKPFIHFSAFSNKCTKSKKLTLKSDTITYRFGFNGQEKDDEVSGVGNTMTAEFWEYDARLGRRWNLDPKPRIGISEYSVFGNNPIWFMDPLGDTWINGYAKDKAKAEENLKTKQNELNSKQKSFEEKYKNTEVKSLNGDALKDYNNELSSLKEAKDKFASAQYELDDLTKKFDLANELIKEFKIQASNAYDFWDKDAKGRDIEVIVSNFPVPGGDQERGIPTKNGMILEIRIHPDWKIDNLNLNIYNMAHGLGHKFSYLMGKENGNERELGESNANYYAEIILGRKKEGVDPRNYLSEFK
jgi:RHS repeat-associated protein